MVTFSALEEVLVIEPNNVVQLAYRLDVNRYNGTERVQLVVEYLKKL